MENENQENIEEKVQEIIQEVVPSEEPVKEERPERNYQAELDRKNREIERLRAEAETRSSVQRRDPQDITTWSDHELRAIAASNDPAVMAYKEQADNVLFERRVRSIREKERMQDKRALSEMELRSKYPEALDHSSEFALKMEQVMYEFDLQKTPAGRLAAARLVAAELGIKKSNVVGRKSESERVRDVKAQMVDGDRPKPTASEGPKKTEELKKRALAGDASAIGEMLKQQGVSREDFFNK